MNSLFVMNAINLRPSDWITILYLAITGGLILIFHRNLARWYVYVLGHLVVILGIWCLRFLPETLPVGLQVLRDWYPIATIPLFYWEVAPITQIIFQGYFDDTMIRWEQRLFNGQPSIDLSSRFPSTILSEFLHLCYFSYYMIVVFVPAMLYFTGRHEAFHQAVFAEIFTFNVCLVWYIFTPVTGPRYASEKIKGTLSQGPFFRLVHTIVSNASSKGTAFPSSHCAIAVIVLLCAARYDMVSFIILFPFCTGLVISTVYGRFHYAVDSIAGTLLAAVSFGLFPFIYRLLV